MGEGTLRLLAADNSGIPSPNPHPLADADTQKKQARQGELAWEKDRVRGNALDPYSISGGPYKSL